MSNTIQREISIPQPPEQVWQALTNSTALAEWMFPNDFEPRLGHRFTFEVPPNPKANFDGITVHCEVLEFEPPSNLVLSWTAGGPVVDTRVSFRLEPEGEGTRLFFKHTGFDISQEWGKQAVKGAEYGWARMLDQLAVVVSGQGENKE